MVEYLVDIYTIRRYANGQITSEKGFSNVLKESTVKLVKQACKKIGYKYIGCYKDIYGNYYTQYEREEVEQSSSECRVSYKQIFTKLK